MRFRGWCAAAFVALGVLALPATSTSQGYRMQGISPIFDGWEELPDGTRLFYFGYINRHTSDVNIPVGPDNGFAPGAADRGQPTTFLPGRHEHVFTIEAPKNMEGKLVWTVKSEMGQQTANASFDQLYILEERENEDPNAKPPAITAAAVTAKVNEPVTITPAVKAAVNSGRVEVEGAAAESAGLNVQWSKYRGPGAVTFTRQPGAPMAPPAAAGERGGRRAVAARPGVFGVPCGTQPGPACGAVQAKFTEPGEYLLRAAARQDGLEARAFVRVTVRP